MTSNNLQKAISNFFNNYEYQILELAGIISGLLIIYVANLYFLHNSLYYFLIILGLIIASFGFVISYFIIYEKKKAFERDYGYFLEDLSSSYAETKNISVALDKISTNYYGSIDAEIKLIALRVSWGLSLEDALSSINKKINSLVISHSLLVLDGYKDTSVPYDIILKNIAKDLAIYKEDTQKQKYFSNLFLLSIVFYFIFLLVILYIDFIVGRNFYWISSLNNITRFYFDNFLLYISLLLAFFTSYVMYSIRGKKLILLLKYTSIFFIITIILFQTFIPKPEAEGLILNSIDYLFKENKNEITIETAISFKSISSKYLVSSSSASMVYFIPKANNNCGKDCYEYTIVVKDPHFYSFDIKRIEKEIFVYYELLD
ncbi:MAG: hypothetical protein V1824_00850 [archaeon]